MNNRYAAILAFATVAIVGAILVLFQLPADRIPGNNPIVKVKEVHYHAAFRIYKDGVFQDFSATDYMHIKPCTVDEDAHEDDGETIHLHDLVGNVVHVHAAGKSWKDLFTYLKLPIPTTVTAYNGTSALMAPLEGPIKPYQSVTFFIGAEPGAVGKQTILEETPTKDYIMEIEKKSENCATP